MVPRPDQWKFLSELRRLEPATVDGVAREATRKGLVGGVRLSDTPDPDTSEPWTRPLSGQASVRFAAPLPHEVRAVLAQRLFVGKGGLSPTHLNQIKRLAAFQNPEFLQEAEFSAVHGTDSSRRLRVPRNWLSMWRCPADAGASLSRSFRSTGAHSASKISGVTASRWRSPSKVG